MIYFHENNDSFRNPTENMIPRESARYKLYALVQQYDLRGTYVLCLFCCFSVMDFICKYNMTT